MAYLMVTACLLSLVGGRWLATPSLSVRPPHAHPSLGAHTYAAPEGDAPLFSLPGNAAWLGRCFSPSHFLGGHVIPPPSAVSCPGLELMCWAAA